MLNDLTSSKNINSSKVLISLKKSREKLGHEAIEIVLDNILNREETEAGLEIFEAFKNYYEPAIKSLAPAAGVQIYFEDYTNIRDKYCAKYVKQEGGSTMCSCKGCIFNTYQGCDIKSTREFPISPDNSNALSRTYYCISSQIERMAIHEQRDITVIWDFIEMVELFQQIAREKKKV